MLQSTRLQRVRHNFATEQPQPYILNRLPWWLNGKEPTCKCRRCGFDPWFRKIPWRSKWKPTPVFLPGKSHGKRSLAGYNPWGHKRVGHNSATKHTHTYIHDTTRTFSISWLRKCRCTNSVPFSWSIQFAFTFFYPQAPVKTSIYHDFLKIIVSQNGT